MDPGRLGQNRLAAQVNPNQIMARVYPGEIRIKVRSFDFYPQLIGGHDTIYVRRKIGEPCDTLHPANRALKLQRLRITKAAQDWSKLNYFQKKWWRNQMQWVD